MNVKLVRKRKKGRENDGNVKWREKVDREEKREFVEWMKGDLKE